MKLVTGTVIDGHIVVDGERLAEGARVTIIAPDGEGAFHLDTEGESKLLEAVAEADRGEFVSAEDLLRDLLQK